MSTLTPLIITRIFDYPRDQVWDAFTNGESLAQWWGPKGGDTTTERFTFAPGEMFLYVMRNKQGMEMWGRFIYQEIEPKDRFTYVSSFSDPDGGLTRAPFWDGQFPLEVMNEITFEDLDGKTRVTLRGAPIRATEAEEVFFHSVHASMQGGFGNTLDQLTEFLAR